MAKIKAVPMDLAQRKTRKTEQQFVNLLNMARVEISSESGEVKVENAYIKDFSQKHLKILTSGYIENHVDIHCMDYTISYDLGKAEYVNTLCFYSYYNDCTNMGVEEFTVYAGTTPENTEEIAFVDNRGKYQKGSIRNNSDWMYQIDAEIRFLKIHIVSSDIISRLEWIALYNDKINEQHTYISESFGKNEFQNVSVTASGVTSGKPETLTNGLAFAESTELLDGSVALKIEKDVKITQVFVLGTGSGLPQLNAEGKNVEFTKSGAPNSRNLYTAKIPDGAKNQFKLSFAGSWKIDQIFATSEIREVLVDAEKVLCNDFLGVGANVVPTSFMPEAAKLGFNDVYWQLEKRRMQICKPHVARVWFQVDWIVDNEIDYICGKYNFESAEMKSVYKYIEALGEAGCDIDLNFGWKAGTKIQEWFAMEGVRPEKRLNSAPNDLKHFGIACAETLKELIVNRKYANVKYLSLYNEPDYGGCESQSGDFVVPDAGYRYPYWRDMMLEVYKAAKDNGVLDKFKFWGHEGSLDKSWITNLNKDCKFLDTHTVHRYTLKYNEAVEAFSEYKRYAEDKSIALTEFGTFGRRYITDNCNHIEMVIAAANCGYSAMLIWILNGEYLVDPLSWAHAGSTDNMDGSFSFWDLLCIDGCINNVGESYYELSPFMNYVPKHSKTISSTVKNCDDCRAVAFKTQSGDYTVVVESESSIKEQSLKLKFKKQINKKFYKYVYVRQNAEGNMIIPPLKGEFDVADSISDTIPKEYTAIIYSTIPPVPQVALNAVEFTAKPGETVEITARIIDGNEKAAWDIAAACGEAGTLECGKYTLSSNSKPGDMAAVRASIGNDGKHYAVAIVKTI